MGMIETIKKAGLGAVNATNPVNILFGEVLDIKDFKIKIDQKRILSKKFFIIPESLTRYEIDFSHMHNFTEGLTSSSLGKVVIREGLKSGDKVILLRLQGGDEYLILDKVV